MSTLAVNAISPASGGTVTITGAALTTPALGTPASGNLANCTGLPASSVVNTPSGGISATTVQAALNELDTAVADRLSKSAGGTIGANLTVTGNTEVGGTFGLGMTPSLTNMAVRQTTLYGFSLSTAAQEYTMRIDGAAGNALVIGNRTASADLLKLSSSGNLLPGADNAYDHGSASYAIKQIYTNNSVIVTSDARLKTARPYSVKERAVARRCRDLGIVYQWNESIAQKGADRARMHFGTTVQSVIAAFEAEGLDPLRYGVVCYDEWQAEVIEHPAVEALEAVPAVPEVWEEVEVDITIRVNGQDRPAKRAVLQLVQPAVPAKPAVQAREAYTETVREAGNRYSLRLDQLAFFIATARA